MPLIVVLWSLAGVIHILRTPYLPNRWEILACGPVVWLGALLAFIVTSVTQD